MENRENIISEKLRLLEKKQRSRRAFNAIAVVSLLIISVAGMLLAYNSALRTHVAQLDAALAVKRADLAIDSIRRVDAFPVAISPSGNFTAKAEAESIVVYDLESRPVVRILYDDYISAISFSPSGDRIVVASWGSVHIFDIKNSTELLTVNLESTIEEMVMSKDGDYLFIVTEQGKLMMINARTGELVHQSRG